MINKLLITLITVFYLFFGYHHVFFGLSLGAILIIFGFLNLFLSKSFSRMMFDKSVIINLIVALFFSILLVLINFSFSWNLILSWIWIIIILVYFKGISENGYFLFFKKVYFTVVLLSLCVAILQSFQIDFFWDIRNFFPTIDDKTVLQQIEMRTAPPGLAYYNVQLSNQVSSLLVFYNLLISKNSNPNKGLFFNSFLMIGSFLTLISSSFVLAALIITFRYLFYSKSKIKYLGFVIFPFIGIYLFSIFFLDPTKLSRVSFLYVGLLILIANPYGVPFSEQYNEKVKVISELVGNLPMLDALYETSFHNTFINIGVQVGLIGLIVYVWIYYYNIYRLREVLFVNINRQKLLISVIMICYLIQFVTHNSGPYTGDPYYWMVFGAILGNYYRKKVISKKLE